MLLVSKSLMSSLVPASCRSLHSARWLGPCWHSGLAQRGAEQREHSTTPSFTEDSGARHSRHTGVVTAGGPTTLGTSVITVSRGEISRVATR